MKRYIALAFIFSILSLSVFSSPKESVSLQSLFDSYQKTLVKSEKEKEPSDYTLKDALKSYSDSFLPEEVSPKEVGDDSTGKEVTAAQKAGSTGYREIEEAKTIGKEGLPYYSEVFEYDGWTIKVSIYSDHTVLEINSTLGKEYSSLMSYIIAYCMEIYDVSCTVEDNRVTIHYPELTESTMDEIASYLFPTDSSPQETESVTEKNIPEAKEEIPVENPPSLSSSKEEKAVSSSPIEEELPLFVRTYNIQGQAAKVSVYPDHAVLNTGTALSSRDIESLARSFSSAYPIVKDLRYTLSDSTLTLYYPLQSEEFLSSALDAVERDIRGYLALQATQTKAEVTSTPSVKEQIPPVEVPAVVAPESPIVEERAENKAAATENAFRFDKFSAHAIFSASTDFVSFKIGARYDFTDHISARFNIFNGLEAQVLYVSKLSSQENMSVYGGCGLGYSTLNKLNAQLFVGLEMYFNSFSAAIEMGFVNTKPQASAVISYHFDL